MGSETAGLRTDDEGARLAPGWLMGAALAGGLVVLAVQGSMVAGWPLALMAALAVLGLSSLVWWGVQRARPAPASDALAQALVRAAAAPTALVEGGTRLVAANDAYSRRYPPGQAPLLPETVIARLPGSAAPLADLLRAIARREASVREIPDPAAGVGAGLVASVTPVAGTRRVLWTLAAREPALPQALTAPSAPLAAAKPTAASVRMGDAAETPLALWDRAPLALALLGPDAVRLPNAPFARFLGYGLAELESDGVALAELIDAADLPAVRAALATGGTLPAKLVAKDAARLPATLAIAPADASGEGVIAIVPSEYVSVRRDDAPAATPVAAAEAATVLPETPDGQDQETSEAFFARSPLAIAVVDALGVIRSANAGFVRLFATAAPSGLVGRTVGDLVSERDGEAIGALLAEARAAGLSGAPAAPRDATIPGEGTRSARFYAATLGPGETGTALYAVDTTAQKALEAQFAQSQKMQAVGQLAGGVAHDFNNMLTAIIGYCDLLLSTHGRTDPSFADIMQIKQNANRAAALVRQLLAFSRRQTLRPQVIELTDVISELSHLLRRLIGETITLEVHHARDLWPVKVDVNQFEQVIVNLVVNARDAMPEGGALTLSTRNVAAHEAAAFGTLAPADYVLIEVEDTGTGIPATILDNIFEPFFSTKEVGQGTGLGLSMVYGIIQQTGGSILVASEVGRGTIFRVFLPRHVEAQEVKPAADVPSPSAAPADASAAPAPAGPPATEAEPRLADLTGQGTVLLVEDEDAVRALASRVLSGRGYRVLAAASGVEALALYTEAGTVDLVVSDVVMPEMDGPTLLRELRARAPGLKVIFMSGYAEEAFARNLPPDEKFSFLPKPFSLKQLIAAVKEAMET